MKPKFKVIERHPHSKDANYIIAVVVPFWAKKDDSTNYQNTLTRLVRDLESSTHAKDALFCTYNFDGSELFDKGALIKGALIHSLSDRLVDELTAVRENASVEYRPPNSSSVDMESNKSSSESHVKRRVRLPIVFIAHSLASWVVRHLLSGTPYDNSSIMFATRGVIFLDTPHESLATSLKEEKVEEYLNSLSAFLRGKTGASSSTQNLLKELKDIDREFERLQNTAFVHRQKAHGLGGPAVPTRFSELWTTAPESGIVVFSERYKNHPKVGFGRIRKILGRETEQEQLERTKPRQSNRELDLGSLLENVLELHSRLHEHHTETQSLTPNDTAVPTENHPVLTSGTLVQPPEAIPEEAGLLTAPPMRKSWQSSVDDPKSTNRLSSSDSLGEHVAPARQGPVALGRWLRQNRKDSWGDGVSVTSEKSDITQPGGLKSFVRDSAYGDAYRETLDLANSYYQRAEFANAKAAFQRSKALLAAMGPSVRQSYELIAIDEQLAAISMYRGYYSKAKTSFEEILKTTRGLEQIPSVQKKELLQDLRRWTAVVLLHQGQYNKAVSEFKALLEDGQNDDSRTTSGAQRMLRIHVHRDLSLALAHVGPYSMVQEQIGSAEEELKKYSKTQESALDITAVRAQPEVEKVLTVSGTDAVKPDAQSRMEDKPSMNLHRKLAVKREYMCFVQAVIHYLWGSYDRALETCEEALRGLEKRLGVRHMKTLECASLKAFLLAKNYHLSAAETCCNETLQTMRRELGRNHPHTLETTGHLVYIFTSQYRLVEAIATASSLQTSTKEFFGDNHPQTLSSRLLFSQAKIATGDYTDALGGLRELVMASKSFYGEENLITLTHNATYARALHHAGAFKEAERVAKLTLRREKMFFSIPIGLDITTNEICQSFQGLIRERTEAMGRKSDDWRIHPLFLLTLETVALIELSKKCSDRTSAREILGSCWRWKSGVLGKDHAFTLAAEYDFAMTFEDEGEDYEETLKRQKHIRHIYLQRIATLKDTHPDVLTARRELVIINCTLGVWTDFPNPSEDDPNTNRENADGKESSGLTDTAPTSKTMDDEMWALAEIESKRIFSLHKMELGGSHPETLKSHLWLFQLQLQLGCDVEKRTCMESLLSELREPTLLHQRLVDSVRIRQQMALALQYSGHLRQAARILHQIPEEMKASPIINDPLFAETLDQLEQATQQNILETMLEAQRHPNYKTRLQVLRSMAETSTKETGKASEPQEHLSEAFELCELLYGPDHPHTLKAREQVVLATWDPEDESAMKDAIKLLSELIATLKASSGVAQREELRKVHDQWVQELDKRTKETDLEDDVEE